MPLNTNLLRASAGIELPDQLARMATVEQIRSAQMNQETARINQQIHNESLAKTRRAQQYLEQLVPKLTSLGAPDQLEAQVLALLNAPDENLQKHGADMLKVWQQASREKRWSDRFGTPPEPTVATGAIQSPEIKVSLLETGPSGVAPQTFNAPAGVAGVVVGREQPPPMRLNNLPGASEGLAQNRLKMIQDARAEVSFAAREAASNPSALPYLTAAQNRLQELVNSPLGEPGKTYMVNGKPVQMPLAPLDSQREFEATQGDPAYAAYLQSKRAPVGVSRGERLFNPATGKIVAEGLPPEAPPLEKIVDSAGNVKFAPRSQAVGQTPASEFIGVSPKELQKREAVYPQATQAVKGFETKSDQFIKELEKLRDDPGLANITGPVFGRTPSVTREGSRAQSTYDKIFAKGGFQALQDMREMSKTGGALGNVSNEEGRRLEKSVVGGLDRTQNIADVKQGIDDLIAEIRVSKARVRETYDSTYEYRAGRPAAAPAAPAGKEKRPLSAFETK
jgi:hypothetical protein